MADRPTSELLYRSASQLSTFSKCGEQYRLEKVARAPSRPAAWFMQGTAVHAAIELYESVGRDIAPAEVLSHYDAKWAESYEEALVKEPDVSQWMTGGRKLPANDIRDRLVRGREQVARYMDWAPRQPWRPLELGPGEYAVEVPFVVKFGAIEVRGSIDQVLDFGDDVLLVRDIKTGSRKPDWHLQLLVYKYALEDEWGIDLAWGDYLMTRDMESCTPIDLTRHGREMVEEMFTQMDEAEKLGIFLPNPGDHCRTCGVKDYCLAVGGRAVEFSPFKERGLSEHI